MKNQHIKAAILDMDGVITQTARVHARAWKAMFDDFLKQRRQDDDDDGGGGGDGGGEPFDIESDYREFVDGKPRYDGVRSFLESRGIELPFGQESDAPDRQTVCGLGNRKNQLFRELLRRDGVQVYEDAVEQVDRWKREGVKVAVISSSRNCEAVLRAAGLLDRFDAKVDGNDLVRLELDGKPAPDMFLHAARELGVEPESAIVVEDALAGIEAGRRGNFGMVVGVARERDGADLKRAGSDLVVRGLGEIAAAGYCPPEEDCLASPSSARQHLRWILQRARGKRLALFLDYDGTLTPIVRRPEDATLSDEMRSLLSELSSHCTLAIVSGRDRPDAERMVQLENLVYAGSHGFDIRGPDGLRMQHEDARAALPQLDEAEQTLKEELREIPGSRVERKKFAVAVHYREVEGEEQNEKVVRAVDRVVSRHPELRKRGGKKIFELQPDIPWDKGRAILWLADALGLEPAATLLLYLGDDVTDEDAFRALRRHGTGIGIRVADATDPTEALYYLRDCDEVRDFLAALLAMLAEPESEATEAEEIKETEES